VAPAANREAHLRWHRALTDAGTRAGTAAAAAPAPGPEPTVLRLGSAAELPGDAEAYVLLAAPALELDEDAGTVLAAAARHAAADAVVFPVRSADGRVVLPLGGPPELVPFTEVMAAGGALVRRSLLETVPGDERGLDGLLAAAVLAGHRLLAFPDAVAGEREPVARPSEAFFAWWPSPEEIARSGAGPLGRALPLTVAALPVLSALTAEQLALTQERLSASDALVRRLDADWKEAHGLLVAREEELRQARSQLRRRDEELLGLMHSLGEAQGQAEYERGRLAALRNRRAVRAALKLASLRSVFARS
jgi:hypothetical protein